MSYSTNFIMYTIDCLNLPISQRCHELTRLMNVCSVKELQDFFPILVQSVFGSGPGGNQVGWGLRTYTSVTYHDQETKNAYRDLTEFFNSQGAMFDACYKLLNEQIKFDVPLDQLPLKTCEMLYTGRYSQFYADLINVDPTIRQITSLSLNAFDYYMLHFALHGLHPLHRTSPAALDVHNEKTDTIYVCLCANYVCSFLLSDPNEVVLPNNICGNVKIASVLAPIQPIQPTYSPKYLKMNALNYTYNANASSSSPSSNTSHVGNHSPTLSASSQFLHHHHRSHPTGSETTFRSSSWRSESVMYLFIDTWLRYDVDSHRELPSSEFVRCVRILVKQLHAFGNVANVDHTSMFPLRQSAQPLLNAQIYTFLRSLLKRWPLDNSFSVVLELWLSFIQPWRYTVERIKDHEEAVHYRDAQPIQRPFDSFIKENMLSYTQIFIQLLPRFERLDMSSVKNASMMHRLLKVFSQSNLVDLLRANEFDLYASKNMLSSSSPKTSRNGTLAGRSSSGFLQHEDDASGYVCMFGIEVQQQVFNICEKLLMTKQVEVERYAYLVAENDRRLTGMKWLLNWFMFSNEDAIRNRMMNDCRKIPDVLDRILHLLSDMFMIEIPEQAYFDTLRPDVSGLEAHNQSHDMDVSFADISGLDGSRTRISDLQYTVDPAEVPIKANEMTFLVRFLYQFSHKLNVMYQLEMNEVWHRTDRWGRIARQILDSPMTVHRFDKSRGSSVVCESRLTPRLNLRFLGNYQSMFLIFASFAAGQMVFGVPSFGFLLLLLVTASCLCVRSIFYDPLTTT